MKKSVPDRGARGAKLKYRFDLVKHNKPLTLKVTGEKSNGYRRNLPPESVDAKVQSIRSNASAYARRHNVTFQVCITKRSLDGRSVTLQVHHTGKRT